MQNEDKEKALALNRLAREQMKLKLLKDIQFDLAVCEIEGWDKLEYLHEIRALIDSLLIKESKNEA